MRFGKIGALIVLLAACAGGIFVESQRPSRAELSILSILAGASLAASAAGPIVALLHRSPRPVGLRLWGYHGLALGAFAILMGLLNLVPHRMLGLAGLIYGGAALLLIHGVLALVSGVRLFGWSRECVWSRTGLVFCVSHAVILGAWFLTGR